ncbi:MAG TPA: hypothetical protein DEV81_18505 [Cyanobacteria bacterium UBA11049]|nr:hypothetical protein [Cyanobacteria bacterium UBA11049]
MSIQEFAFASLRARLTAIVIFAVLPLYVFILLNNLQISHTFNCTVLALLATGAIAIIWVGSEFMLLRWLRLLINLSKNLAAGNFNVRINNLQTLPTEIRQLAETFNSLAASLERQLTAARHMSAQLSRANERFQLAAAAVKAIIYEWDIENKTIERTQGLVEVLGYQPEETGSSPNWWLERVHSDDRERIRKTVYAACNNGSDRDFELEYRILNNNNQYIYVWDRGLILRNADGRAVRVVGSILDINDRKRVEEKLRESEQRFYQIAENIREVLWIATPDISQIIYINPVYEKMWGRSCENLYAQPKSFLEGIHPQDRDRVISYCKQNFLSDYNHEYQIVRPDGTIRWVRSRVFPIRDRSGEIYRLFGLMEDITQRKYWEAETKQLNETLEQRVQERTAQLEAANQELDAFSYSVSHDLRAPLRHIRGFVDALALQLQQSGEIANPKLRHYIEVIQHSTDKMGQLIDALLTLSRLGRQPLVSHPVNLRQLVDAAIVLVKDRTQTNEHSSIEFSIGDLPTVSGDPTLLQQVFSNLIDNAVKFSCNCQVAQIEVGTLPDSTIFVKDNGVGFQMEYAEQLFAAFGRLHSQKEFKGTGIGLAIVQRIIHRHGGTIWAESVVHQGATFYFKLGAGNG